MIKPSLPQDRAALIDKDFRVTLPYRRWMNDLTRLALELQAAGAGTGTTTDPLAFTITGSGWISVTGSIESGNFNVTQRTGLTTADLAEGSNLYHTDARRSEVLVADGMSAPPVMLTNETEDDFIHQG